MSGSTAPQAGSTAPPAATSTEGLQRSGSTAPPASVSDSEAGWKGGAASVALLTFAVDAETPVLAAGRRYANHAMVMSHQAYDTRKGLPRLLTILDEYAVKATFFVPGVVAEWWPGSVTEIAERGHEIAHHSYTHRPSTRLTRVQEREEFERGMAALDRLDIRPTGYRSPMWAATWHSAELASEFGLSYDTSLMDDDTPYVIETDSGHLVELPVHWTLDDWEQYAYLPEPHLGYVIEPPDKALGLWLAELDGMREWGGLFQLTTHSFLSGRPGRARNLRRLIEAVLERGDVVFRTGEQVCAAVLADQSLQRRKHQPRQVDPDIYPDW